MDESILYKINTPDVLWIQGSHPNDGMFMVVEPFTFLMTLGYLQSFFSP